MSARRPFRLKLALTAAAGLSLLATVAATSASAEPYRHGATSSNHRITEGPGGGGGGQFYNYDPTPLFDGDLAVGQTDPKFPLYAETKRLCAQIYASDAKSITRSMRDDCARKVGADVMKVPDGRVNFGRAGHEMAGGGMNACTEEIFPDFRGEGRPVCWTVGSKNWSSSPSNIQWSHYTRNNVPQAQNVIAWNIRIWRYDVTNTRAGAAQSPKPFFERRIDINNSKQRTSQERWWWGGAGTTATGPAAGRRGGGYWWGANAYAGPLGPGAPGNGAVPAECVRRYNDWKAAYSASGELNLGNQSLSDYVTGGTNRHVCFYPSGVKGKPAGYGYEPTGPIEFDANQKKAGAQTVAESVALSWNYSRTGAPVLLDYTIQGQPGYIYLAHIVALDNRQEIMGQTVRFFFDDAWETPPPPTTPTPGCPPTDPRYPTCEPSNDPTPTPGQFTTPEVTIEGPETAIAGRPNTYSLLSSNPAAGVNENSTLVVKRSRLSVSDPNESNAIADADRRTIFDVDYYDRAMTFAETNGGGAEPRTYAKPAALAHAVKTAGQGERSAVQDVLAFRDANGHADVIGAKPLASRGQNVAWLEPSNEPGMYSTIFGEVQYDTARKTYNSHLPAAAEEYSKPNAPQMACAASVPNGRWCLNHEPNLRDWSADGGSDGKLALSGHWPGRNQLAQAYQHHASQGAFVVKLDTNRPELVRNLRLYNRGTTNNSIRADVTQAGPDGEWGVYFCRPGRWQDGRIYRGANSTQAASFNAQAASVTDYGDEFCRRDFWQWQWASTPSPDELDLCRPAAPGWGATRSWLTRDGLPQAADVRGQLPNESLRRCTFRNANGYVQNGEWLVTEWEWRWNPASAANCYGNNPSRAQSGGLRYPAAPADSNGNRKQAPLPTAQGTRCADAGLPGHVDGFWTKKGHTFVWGHGGASCGRNNPSVPQIKAGGNSGAYVNHEAASNGIMIRIRQGSPNTTGQQAFYSWQGQSRTSSYRPRCSFLDDQGYQYSGQFHRRPAEAGFAQSTARIQALRDAGRTVNEASRGRLEPGQYQVVADFNPTSNMDQVRWRLDGWSFDPKGSRWDWSSNRWAPGGTVMTEVLALQQTR